MFLNRLNYFIMPEIGDWPKRHSPIVAAIHLPQRLNVVAGFNQIDG
jgi:hypothetical protein